MASATNSKDDNAESKRKRKQAEEDPRTHKKRRKEKGSSTGASNSVKAMEDAPVDEVTNGIKSSLALMEDPAINGHGPEDPKSFLPPRRRHRWRVLPPMGGRMAGIDPIFSSDEAHLIITYNTSIQVYSTKDSLLVRRIPIPITSNSEAAPFVVSVEASKLSDNLIWVSASDGRLWKIDWTTGTGRDKPWSNFGSSIFATTVETMDIDSKQREVFLVSERCKIDHEKPGPASILALHDVAEGTSSVRYELQAFGQRIWKIISVDGGNTIVATTSRQLIVGVKNPGGNASMADFAYDFRAVPTDDDVASIAVRCTSNSSKSKSKGSHGTAQNTVDVVIGCLRGAEYVYADIVSRLYAPAGAAPDRRRLLPKKHHWHQRAVRSVAWSTDGNYVISGGIEGVLVQWQLDTGKLSVLPHLTAAIDNVIVSPKGSSYAVHLSNNSVMVLSTAELKPTTYVSGLQALAFSPNKVLKSEPKRVTDVVEEINAPLQASINPANSSQMFLCVGSSQEAAFAGKMPATPMLQLFDFASFQSVSTQSLTRTNITQADFSPEGQRIEEPRVTSMAVNKDGRWLATVDEWQPQQRDLKQYRGNAEDISSQREVSLKFWEARADGSPLGLVTRIDGPHDTQESQSVLDVVASPAANRFASLGSDGILRFWSPKSRQTDGLPAKSNHAEALVTWRCDTAIDLSDSMAASGDICLFDAQAAPEASGALCFSDDGSLMLAAFGSSDNVVVHVINADTGGTLIHLHGLTKGVVRQTRMLDGCLIISSDIIAVYDLVRDELRYSISLPMDKGPAAQLTHIAVDPKSHTFAVATPKWANRGGKFRKGVASELVIFNLTEPSPSLVKKMPHLVTSLLASPSEGYLLLDSAAQIWSIALDTGVGGIAQPLNELQLDGVQTEEKVARPAKSLSLILNGDQDDEGSDGEQPQDAMDVDEDDANGDDDVYVAVVAPQKLAQIFDAAPAFAMPPMEDVFFQVASLFGQKPLGTTTA